MTEYLMLFCKELSSHGIGGLVLFVLASGLAFMAGHLFRDCFMQRNNKYFSWYAIWLPVSVLLFSVLCGGFLIVSFVTEVIVVMLVWLVISVVVGALISINKSV